MRRLYKLGGSLLSHPDLSKILGQFFTAEAKFAALNLMPFEPMIVTGGGSTADLVRLWDSQHSLGAETAHWLALKALDFNAELLHKVFINSEIASNQLEISKAWEHSLIPLLTPFKFVEALEPISKIPLPHNWDVTTDSVALWLSYHLQIEEYIFLKSCESPREYFRSSEKYLDTDKLTAICQRELIDPYFPTLYKQLPTPPSIRWINLRSFLQ